MYPYSVYPGSVLLYEPQRSHHIRFTVRWLNNVRYNTKRLDMRWDPEIDFQQIQEDLQHNADPEIDFQWGTKCAENAALKDRSIGWRR